jgi:hypothetical protein
LGNTYPVALAMLFGLRFSLIRKGLVLILLLPFAYDQEARPLLRISDGPLSSWSTNHLFGQILRHDSSCKLPTL